MSKPKIEKDAHRWCDVNGQRHRLDGPAVIWADGTQAWYMNGQRHRLDGPAFIWADGTQAWWVNGQRHRLDGPAVIWADGTQEWWVNGKNITREANQWMTQQRVTWPWDSNTHAQFLLTWV